LLVNIAKGGSNPDLQLRALNYMAMSGNRNVAPDLVAIYNASHNQTVKKQVLNSLMMAKASDELFNIARTEQDAALRNGAIEYLGVLHQADKLHQLYQAGIAKQNIIESMIVLHDPARLVEIIRTEKDPKLRAAAIEALGVIHSDQASEGLVSLYGSESDAGAKKQIIDALWLQRNAKALIDLARKETDPQMKKEIVLKLSTMKSKEANDYMLEILK
jgi:HEAT repeat protein